MPQSGSETKFKPGGAGPKLLISGSQIGRNHKDRPPVLDCNPALEVKFRYEYLNSGEVVIAKSQSLTEFPTLPVFTISSNYEELSKLQKIYTPFL